MDVFWLGGDQLTTYGDELTRFKFSAWNGKNAQ